MRIAAAVASMWAGMLRKVGLHPKKNKAGISWLVTLVQTDQIKHV